VSPVRKVNKDRKVNKERQEQRVIREILDRRVRVVVVAALGLLVVLVLVVLEERRALQVLRAYQASLEPSERLDLRVQLGRRGRRAPKVSQEPMEHRAPLEYLERPGPLESPVP